MTASTKHYSYCKKQAHQSFSQPSGIMDPNLLVEQWTTMWWALTSW